MSKIKRIMIIIGGLIAFIVLGIFIYLMNPIFSQDEYDFYSCMDNDSGTNQITHCSIYNLNFFINDNGIHFLSNKQFNKIKENISSIKEKTKDDKPVDETDYKLNYCCKDFRVGCVFYNLDGKYYVESDTYNISDELMSLNELCNEIGDIYNEK